MLVYSSSMQYNYVEGAQGEGVGEVVKKETPLARDITESCGHLKVTLASHLGFVGRSSNGSQWKETKSYDKCEIPVI